ncbi:MAG TPA: sulfate adenylyltransferase [Planctomycetota bacterium]|nr:sulfate adenylyltransferase [Planctomycetota bacterium]
MTLSTSSSVSPVHGGLTEPVDLIVSPADVDLAAWQALPRVDVNEIDATTLYRVADGTLSPLTGPMGHADQDSVLERAAIEREGQWWAWGIPIILPLTDAEAEQCSAGATVGLWRDGELFGTLEVDEVHDWDKERFIAGVYGTERTDHPGARLWTADERSKLVGGSIRLLPFNDQRAFASRVLSPREVRALIESAGFEQTVAFQTRNPLHRAHEYALVHGAETILRETGKRTGVILNPLVGQLKGDDVPAAERMQTYEALLEGRFLGQGDMDEALWSAAGQDLNDQLELIGLDIRMYYGGPREAIQHAVYRQNMGFTHFIIGRKHADAPFDNGDAIWGDFDAQVVFENLGGSLAIQTVNVGFAAFFEELGRVGLMGDNKGKTAVGISGTKMREILGRGELPDERVMRPSTARILAAFYQSQEK